MAVMKSGPLAEQVADAAAVPARATRQRSKAALRYTQSKERSAEILRMTVSQMARHPAALNPVTFAVWYEHMAGSNPPLSAALDRLQAVAQPLDEDAVLELYLAHILSGDTEAVERIGQQLQQVMAGISRSASVTGSHAGAFGAQLDGLAAALAGNDAERLTPQLDAARAHTQDMKKAVEALQGQVAQSRHEIEKLRADLQQARDETLMDPLTGILNRKGFDHRLQELLDEPDDVGHGLVMLDLDHFKQVNDTHGHVIGDRVLQAMGEILRHSIAGTTHAAARYGGEEFAILLPHTALSDCVQLAEDVRQRTRAMKLRRRDTQAVVLTVSVSGGVARRLPGEAGGAFVARADAALYAAKRAGRDRIACA